MERIYHQKLVRDKIPEVIKKAGNQYEVRVMEEAEFEMELRKKILEEVKELMESSVEDLEEEMADVLELLQSLASHYEVDFKLVEEKQKKKREKRGGFKKRLFLIWSSYEGKE